MIKQFFFLALCCCSIPSIAQLKCGNDLLEQDFGHKTPLFTAQKAKDRLQWTQYKQALSASKMIVSGTDTSYEIPVVVHIIHTGEAIGTLFNPSDRAIDSMLRYINSAWAATWPAYKDTFSGGTRIPIKFVLAKRDFNCGPTTGINRVNGASLAGYTSNGVCPFGGAPGPSDAQLKNLSNWPSRDYFNIWLVNKIEGGAVGGYAPWPWYFTDELLDGAVFCAEYARPLGSLGDDYFYTVIHELGHSFGLYHTFQDGCDATGNCLTEGDQICDTEPHAYRGMNCEKGSVNSCTGILFKGVEHNFMNYTTCPDHYTKDQSVRMRYTLRNYRMGLVNSLGATAPAAVFTAPAAACIPGIINASSNLDAGPYTIQFADMITSSSGYKTDAYTTYLDRTCSQQSVKVIPGRSYTISITTKNIIQNIKAWIDYNNDGIFQVTELAYTHYGSLPEEIHSGIISIPLTGIVANTNLRMRIKADSSVINDACEAVQYGQTEDYSVVIQTPANMQNNTIANPSLQLYPNPSSDKITIQADRAVYTTLYSAEGRSVKEHIQGSSIDISSLPDGIYLAYIFQQTDGLLLGIRKIIKVNSNF